MNWLMMNQAKLYSLFFLHKTPLKGTMSVHKFPSSPQPLALHTLWQHLYLFIRQILKCIASLEYTQYFFTPKYTHLNSF